MTLKKFQEMSWKNKQSNILYNNIEQQKLQNQKKKKRLKQRLEKERLEKERLKKEKRLEKERLRKERLEREKIEYSEKINKRPRRKIIKETPPSKFKVSVQLPDGTILETWNLDYVTKVIIEKVCKIHRSKQKANIELGLHYDRDGKINLPGTIAGAPRLKLMLKQYDIDWEKIICEEIL